LFHLAFAPLTGAGAGEEGSMEVRIHDKILWHACEIAVRGKKKLIDDPRKYFPLLARGSWFLDYRQATIFFDVVKQCVDDEKKGIVNNISFGANMNALLGQLWCQAAEELVNSMEKEWKAEKAIVDDARSRLGKAMHIDDLGAYTASDHLDVLDSSEKFAKDEEEYFQTNPLGRGKTIDDVFAFHMKYRLKEALAPQAGEKDGAFAWLPMTKFGEVLHIMADFYAHSNYVELLLWSLAPHLKDTLVAAFNEVPSIGPGDLVRCLCPLPQPPDVEDKTRSNTMFCYRATPANTPLVSPLFVLDDTVQSLFRRYAEHLLLLESDLTPKEYEKELDEQIDLIMAVFNMSQTPVVGLARKLYVGADAAIRSLGKVVRGFMADQLRKIAAKPGSQHGDKLLFAANLVERLSAAEARKWAQSNEYRYVAYSIERQLAKELDFGSTPLSARPFRLPHHSLLRKDENKPDLAGKPGVPTLLRYQLGCLLAVDATARLIEWRFQSKTPERDDAMSIFQKKVRHPSKQLAEMNDSPSHERLKKLGEIIVDVALVDWETFLDDRTRTEEFLEVIP
jgi:hypothetical protein